MEPADPRESADPDPFATQAYPEKVPGGEALTIGLFPAPPPVTRAQFEAALLDAGLLSADELQRFLQGFAPGGQPADADRLARELVRAGKLTRYQAGAVYQGKTRGLLVGPYEVLDKLGAGGMGMVFKARHRARRNVVALKLLPPSFARNSAAVLRFEREARAMARLNHPNVVAVLDLDESNGLRYLVMDYVDGLDLGRIVREKGPLPVGLTLHCMVQAARGLQAAHDQGIIHRDIKPGNLLLDREGTVKVLDLGLARFRGDEAAQRANAQVPPHELTRSGTFVGTIDFLSPEQATDSRRVDPRADVYSLGCTLYYLLTAKTPYQGATMLAQLVAHREEPIPSLRDARPDTPPVLDRLLQRMLAKDPQGRPDSMTEVMAELESCRVNLGRSSPVASEPPGAAFDFAGLLIDVGPPDQGSDPAPVPEERRIEARKRGLLIGVTALAVGVAALGVVARAVRPPGDSPRPRALPAVTVTPPLAPAPAPAIPRPSATVGEVRRFSGHAPGAVRAVAVSPDGLQALSCGDDGTVRLWDVETGLEVHRFTGHDGPVLEVAFSPNGLEAISCGKDGHLILWDLDAHAESLRLTGHAGAVRSVAFAPDGTRVLSGGEDMTLRLWDLSTGKQIGLFKGHDRPVNSVAFSPDDLRALSGSEKTLRLWDLKTYQEIASLPGHRGPVWCVTFSADGRHALSSGADGSVRYWDVKQRRQLQPLEDHAAPVRAVAFSPDGLRALSADEKGAMIYWDLETGQRLRTFPTDPYKVTSLAFLPDGRQALLACDDGLARLWKLPEPPRRGSLRPR